MVQVVTGDYDTFGSLVHGIPTPSAIEYIQNEFNKGSQVLQNLSSTIWEGAQNMYNSYISEAALQKAKGAFRKLQHVWDMDIITDMMRIDQFQQAKPIMQRWIMAEPTTRSLYHNNLLDGYSDRYVDYSPGQVGEEHYDYRRVMDGIVVLNEDDNQPWVATTFMDELLPDDGDLSLEEQSGILETWKHLVYHIRQKDEDPTSPFNSKMM